MLLRLRSALQKAPGSNTIHISQAGEITLSCQAQAAKLHITFDSIGKHGEPLSVSASKAFVLSFPPQHRLQQSEYSELSLYLPYALLPCFSHQQQRTLAISHFAQTLDGRIASSSGDSKWIGNRENLMHAHKMRALCDAVLIGSATLRTDQPRLNVRHVSGINPLRVIVGDNVGDQDFTAQNREPTLLIRRLDSPALCEGQAEHIALADQNGRIGCREILAALYSRGIRSVYIEGGSATTSFFLKSSALDQVQIHISPCILGAGLSGFGFSGIDTMQQALQFSNPRFLPIGDQVMFLGESPACRSGDSTV